VNEQGQSQGTSQQDMQLKFAKQAVEFAKRHLVTIERFGRFPSRNQFLGRESTEEERKFLEENPIGF
jgi:uncharacterized protein (DUF924 family)